MEVSNKPRSGRLLKRLRRLDAFARYVNKDVLECTDIVKIYPIDNRWRVEHEFTPKLLSRIGDFKFVMLSNQYEILAHPLRGGIFAQFKMALHNFPAIAAIYKSLVFPHVLKQAVQEFLLIAVVVSFDPLILSKAVC